MIEAPPPEPQQRAAPSAGCLRAVTIGLFFAVAAIAVTLTVAVLVGGRNIERPRFIESTPAVGRVPIVGSPPRAVPIAVSVQRRVAESVVRVSGTACQEIQQGTGFAVKTGDVITDAHVVAGERTTNIIDHEGVQRRAVVVLFDPVLDLAVLHIETGRPLPGLAFAPPRLPSNLAVFGHPGGGSLRIVPARLPPTGRFDAVNRDIYGRSIRGSRQLLALATRLAPGDSGAPVVDADGRVVAVAFAIDPGGEPLAYALTSSEVSGVVVEQVGARRNAVSTGRCVTL